MNKITSNLFKKAIHRLDKKQKEYLLNPLIPSVFIAQINQLSLLLTKIYKSQYSSKKDSKQALNYISTINSIMDRVIIQEVNDLIPYFLRRIK